MMARGGARAWAMTFAAASLLVGATVRAQAGGGAGGGAAPVRATSTVEVIDVGRGVDDIISRVRAQQRTQDAAPPAAAGAKAAAGARTGQRQAGKPAEGRAHEADDLRAERPERPHTRPERDRRDGHHADRDLGRHSSPERAREGRK